MGPNCALWKVISVQLEGTQVERTQTWSQSLKSRCSAWYAMLQLYYEMSSLHVARYLWSP